MSSTLDSVRGFASGSPQRIAARAAALTLTFRELLDRASAIARALAAREIAVAALAADNGADWLALDLAAQMAGTVLVPLPLWFSREQMTHAIADSGADALLVDGRAAAAGQRREKRGWASSIGFASTASVRSSPAGAGGSGARWRSASPRPART